MTRETVRWSDPASDADPVLRAVVRYAQSIEPSPAAVAACAAAVAVAEASATQRAYVQRRWRGRPQRALLLVAALFAVAGASLAMTFVPSWRQPVASVPASKSPLPPTKPTVVGSPRTEQPPAPPPAPASAPDALEQGRAAPANPPRAALPAPSASAAVSSTDSTELGLLNTARAELRQHPTRALALLATHAQQFPSSAFAEERAALRVEALLKLGQTAEAERAYASFNTAFPGSIYQVRLNALRSHGSKPLE